MKKKSDFAVYQGDKFICLGTAQECADYMGIKVATIYCIASPAHKKRMKNVNEGVIAIKLDEEG